MDRLTSWGLHLLYRVWLWWITRWGIYQCYRCGTPLILSEVYTYFDTAFSEPECSDCGFDPVCLYQSSEFLKAWNEIRILLHHPRA